jgi:bifunctional polynucleotide phosphatase/kinase
MDMIDKSKRVTMGFDLDWTLVKPKSGHKHPVDRDDWMFLYPTIVEKIRELACAHHIVIFSNQTKSVNTPNDRTELTQKLDAVISALGVSVSVFISWGYGPYRKPKPRMWEYWYEYSGLSHHPDDTYVGDAAGRPKVGKRSKDFADTDHTFALNAGVRFAIPEEIFLNTKDEAVVKVPVPVSPWNAPPLPPTHTPITPPLAKWKSVGEGKELVVMIGAPGSGKSAWIRKTLSEYYRVSQDELGSRDKCMRAVRDALAQNKKVVVDNTNPTMEVRALYIDLARQASAVVRCVHITTPRKLAEHLNAMREDHPIEGVRKPRVPPIGETMYWSKFKEPEIEEGFGEVHSIEFEYSREETPEELFKRWHR